MKKYRYKGNFTVILKDGTRIKRGDITVATLIPAAARSYFVSTTDEAIKVDFKTYTAVDCGHGWYQVEDEHGNEMSETKMRLRHAQKLINKLNNEL